jgi:hypothetical protein
MFSASPTSHGYEASRMTRPSSDGLRKQTRQLQMVLARAALVPAFLGILTRNDACSVGIRGVISGLHGNRDSAHPYPTPESEG